MTDRQKFEVKRIISWKNQISKIDSFLKATNCTKTKKVIFEKTYKVRFFGCVIKQSFDMSEDMFLMFFQWLGEYKKHLESLVDNSDADLVSIADAVINGEITRDGLPL